VSTTTPSEFAYHHPETLAEAIGLLSSIDEARPLAGGHSLLPMMRLRLATPAALVDLAGIDGLDEITLDGGVLRIGALTTHATVAGSATVRSACSALAETAGMIGDRQVRNRGTIGGSLAHADPGADYPTVVTALGATITAAGPGGQRSIPAEEFFTGVFSTALANGELVTEVSVPETRSAAYAKHRHPASGYAVVGVAASLRVEGGTCTAARLVVGGVTGSPVIATAAEGALVDQEPSEQAIATAAATVTEAIRDPIGDTYASGEYRVHLAGVLARQALTKAASA
jgi:carbon-monoxide dehydrogenase medium subunit